MMKPRTITNQIRPFTAAIEVKRRFPGGTARAYTIVRWTMPQRKRAQGLNNRCRLLRTGAQDRKRRIFDRRGDQDQFIEHPNRWRFSLPGCTRHYSASAHRNLTLAFVPARAPIVTVHPRASKSHRFDPSIRVDARRPPWVSKKRKSKKRANVNGAGKEFTMRKSLNSRIFLHMEARESLTSQTRFGRR